nr:uncharacterized mitochondrial protein AtMg00810-like [Tanacetum cinerariifolium]
MKKKIEASTSKANRLRKNESKEEEYTKLKEEEEVKKQKKVKKEKSSKTVTYPTCNTRSSLKALYEAMIGLSNKRKKCLKDIRVAILGLNVLPRSSNYPPQISTQKLEHFDDEEKDNNGNKKGYLGKLEHHGEDFYEKIIEKFKIIYKERAELVKTLREGMDKFNGDETMFDFYKEYKKVLKSIDFHLDDSFMFKDSEKKGTIDDLGKGKAKGGSKPKDGGEEVQAEVNNEPKVDKVVEEDNKAAVSIEVEDHNEENMIEKESDKVKKEQQVEIEKDNKLELIRPYCILPRRSSAKFKTRCVLSQREPDLLVLVPESLYEQTDEELTETDIKRIDADDQAIQTILLGLSEDVYAAVDSCETAKEIWERVRQMMKGSDIGEQEKKAKLFNKWEKFTSTDGESIESYYHWFMQLINDLKRNKHFPENIASNLKFLNNLQPEWKRYVTIVRQTKNLHEADFTQIYYFLKMNQKENVGENGRNQFGQYAGQVAHNQQGFNAWQNGGIQGAQNAGVQSDRNQNGLVVVPGIANQSRTGNVVAAKAEGTGIGNQARCYNCRGLGHIARNCTARPRRRDAAYLQTQLHIAQKEEAGIQLQAEEFDFMAAAGALDEIKEVNANCILMANLYQASTSEQYTDLLEPIPEPQLVPQNDNHVTSVAPSRVHSGDLRTELDRTKEKLELCIIKKEKEYAVLWNNMYTKCEKCKYDKILYDKAYNDMQQKVEQLQAQLRDLKGLLHTARTKRPQPKGNTRNAKVPSASKSSEVKKIVVQICLWCVDSGCSKHMTENIKLVINFVWKFLGTVHFGNDHIVAILGYGDLKWGNITITKVYFVEGLGHNLFSVGQFCDADLEVAFRRNTCFIRDLDGVELLKVNRSTNLYTINLHEMASASPISLMARATPTKSWLWHQRLSHLNFDTINDLAKNDLVSGLPKFKYAKEHLCASCEQGKSKRASHPPKPIPNSKQRHHLLHMDLCGPMRVASINEFKNQVLKEYFDSVGITHETFAAKTPQQNGVVKRRNRTLVEAARTMLIFSHASLFIWAEAIATACYTQNHSIIHRRFNKTPYELIQCRKPNISYLHVFGALCYPKNDREDIGKLSAKGDIGFFIGYSANSVAYRVYNRGTRKIMETMNVTFNELSAMAFEQNCSRPELQKAPRVIPAAHVSQNLQAPTASMSLQDFAPVPTNSSNTPVSSHNADTTLQQHAQEQRNLISSPTASAADNVSNVGFDGELFVNPFGTPSTESVVSSTQYALYGLKQAPRAWYDEFSTFLLQNGFSKGTIDPTLFTRRFDDDILVIQVYVNDIIFGLTDPRYATLFSDLMKSRFEMSMMGEMTFFLGLQVNQSPSGKFINQSKYVHEILKKYVLNTSDIVGTPMDIKDKLDLDQIGTPLDATKYRSMIGALMYLTSSKPDIVHATHLKEVKRIFRYLRGTVNMGLWYTKDSGFELTGFSDADYAGCKDTFKSTSGGA